MKGQAQQVFIYMMVIIIVGFLLVFGYKSIGSLLAKGCDVERTSFVSDLIDNLNKFRSYGTEREVSLNVPCGYQEICFVYTDESNIGDSDNPTIKSIVEEPDIQENIFLIDTKGIVEQIGVVKDIAINFDESSQSNGLKEHCVENTGDRFTFKVKGYGKYVSIQTTP